MLFRSIYLAIIFYFAALPTPHVQSTEVDIVSSVERLQQAEIGKKAKKWRKPLKDVINIVLHLYALRKEGEGEGGGIVEGEEIEQWVSEVLNFSSQYNTNTWSAAQVIGEPNVYPEYGDRHGAWAQSGPKSDDYIEVKFLKKVFIHGIDIYETFHSGGVKAIKTKDPQGELVELWSTTTVQDIHSSRIFSPDLEATDFLSDTIWLDVDCSVAGTWVEIDCVKLKGALPIEWIAN